MQPPHVEFDEAFVARLRAGDERAFRDLVTALTGSLQRLARAYSRDASVVEEAVQETWLGVVRGIAGFEGRSPLRSWIFAILVHQAKKLAVRAHTRGLRESQVDAFKDADPLEGGVLEDGHWREPPAPWDLRNPEAEFLTAEAQQVIVAALEAMPESQRRVVLLRDVEGMSSEEVCNILGLTGTNERVLLHRGRVRVRQALDTYLRGGATAQPAPRRERSPE